MLLKLRYKLLRLLIGKLSIIANVNLDGSVLVGNGLVLNNHFVPCNSLAALTKQNRHCGRLIWPLGSRVLVDHNVFQNEYE